MEEANKPFITPDKLRSLNMLLHRAAPPGTFMRIYYSFIKEDYIIESDQGKFPDFKPSRDLILIAERRYIHE